MRSSAGPLICTILKNQSFHCLWKGATICANIHIYFIKQKGTVWIILIFFGWKYYYKYCIFRDSKDETNFDGKPKWMVSHSFKNLKTCWWWKIIMPQTTIIYDLQPNIYCCCCFLLPAFLFYIDIFRMNNNEQKTRIFFRLPNPEECHFFPNVLSHFGPREVSFFFMVGIFFFVQWLVCRWNRLCDNPI